MTAGRVFFDSLAGYALARLKFRGRGAVTLAIVATMAVPGVVLLIPKFLIIKQFGIYDTYTGMIVPLLADAAGVFIMKNFFENVPVSLEEAAKLDGAGVFRTFWSVVLPIARPALITITIIAFQSSWNELAALPRVPPVAGDQHADDRGSRGCSRARSGPATATRSSSPPR